MLFMWVLSKHHIFQTIETSYGYETHITGYSKARAIYCINYNPVACPHRPQTNKVPLVSYYANEMVSVSVVVRWLFLERFWRSYVDFVLCSMFYVFTPSKQPLSYLK